jgi:hypothetical protein
MRLARGLAFLVLLLVAGHAIAQSDTIRVRASIHDYYTKRAIPGVSIVNPKSSATVSTNHEGYFETVIKRTDTLFLFMPGYRTAKFAVPDSIKKGVYAAHLALEPLSTGLNQSVIIKAPKTLEQIEEERKKLGITPKELDRPEIVITSPISALYEMLSGRAKEREKLKKQIVANEQRKVFRELLDYYNENGLIDLPEDHYDSFIDYCNLPVDFLKYNTDYEITKTIVEMYKKYGLNSGLIR